MDLPAGINLAASLVTIVGTTLTIAQAFRHNPAPYRLHGGAPTHYPPQPPQAAVPAPAPRKTFPSAIQGRRSTVRVGLGYGIGLSVALSIVVLTGTWLLDIFGWGRTGSDPTQQQIVLVALMLMAIMSLFIAAGLAPARRTGSVLSGLLAGVFVAAAFDGATAAITTQISPWTTLADNLRDGFIPSLIGLALSAFFALLGYWAYHRATSRRQAP